MDKEDLARLHVAPLLKLILSSLLVGAWMGLSGSPAESRPRDEVMSGAFRCAPIGDSRKWLDCYYGAAQPARAALGMEPASDAQVGLVSSPVSDGTEPRDVAVRDGVLSGAFRCSSTASDRLWLDCYYAAAQPMRATLGLPPVPQAKTTVLSAHTATDTKSTPQSFGFPTLPKFSDVNNVQSRMADYKFDAYGIFTVTLANGQVWQQVAGDTTIAHWKKPPENYAVRISHGFMGSYNFQVKNEPGLFKVLRLS